MSPAEQKSLAEKLRAAIQREVEKGKSLNAIAKAADVPYSSLHSFMAGQSLKIETAEALGKAIGSPLKM